MHPYPPTPPAAAHTPPAMPSPPTHPRSPARDHSPAPFRMPPHAAGSDITPAAYGARTQRDERIAPHSPSSNSHGGGGVGPRTPRSSRAHHPVRGRDASASSSHGLAPSAAALSVAAAVGVPALAAAGGLSQRMRTTHGAGYAPSTPGNASNVSGYSYTSKPRATAALASSVLSPTAAASIVAMPRTSVYASSSSRSIPHPSSLLSSIAPPPPPPVHYSADGSFHLSGGQSLHPATLGAFSQAVLPPNASTSYAHFASHPITFATSPSSFAPTGAQTNQHLQRMGLASAPSATSLFDHSQTFITNYNASPSISLAPLLPPLGQRAGSSRDDGARHTFPQSQPVSVQKHDRASQTSPRLMPQPAPAAHLPAAASSLLAPPVSAAPALAPGASTFGAGVTVPNPTRRPGYEFTHARLLEYHEALSDLGGAVREEEEDGGPTRELVYPLSFPVGDTLVGFFNSIAHWDEFDIFDLYNVTNGWPLSFAFMMIDRKHNFLSQVGVDPVTAFHFIQEVESNYLPNPYHTATHAADVLHAAFHLVEHTPLLRAGLSALDCFVLYISCAVHDFQHPGLNKQNTPAIHEAERHRNQGRRDEILLFSLCADSCCFVSLLLACVLGINNSFLVNSRAPLALRYNDRSVLESFHISGAFRMMSAQPRCNILQSFAFPLYTKIRKQLIDLVLSTDLAVHFELMGVFKRKLAAAPPPPPAAAAVTPGPAPSPVPAAAPPPAAAGSGSVDLARSEEDRLMLMQIILKCGDLSHPARSRRLHLKWSELVTEEFFQQGDREKILKLPPSMFMDRETTNLAQSQIGFITFLVYPMFQVYAAFSARDYWSKKVELNLEWWHEVARQEGEEKKREAALAAAATAASSTEERSSDADTAEADTEELSESGTAVGSSTIGGRSGFVSEPNSAVSRTSSRRTSVDSANGRRELSPSGSTAPSVSSAASAPAGKSEEKSNNDAAVAVASKSRSSSRRTSVNTSADEAATTATSSKPTVSFNVDVSVAPDASPSPSPADTAAGPAAAPKSASTLTPNSAPILTAPSSSPRRGSSNPSAAAAADSSTTPARVRKSNRRSITESSLLSDNLAILSETAQAAALSAAGASAVEAKEHQAEDAEAAQAQAAAVAASRTHSTGSLPPVSALSSPSTGPAKNLHLSLSLSTNKRRSVMTGVAPPASPLVLSRQITATNDSATHSPSPGTIGLSERRATALQGASPATQGPTPSALSPPVLSVSSARASMMFAPSASATATSSPATAPVLESGSSIDFSALPTLESSSSVTAGPGVSSPLSHLAELEASHGVIYNEVRELASITAVELEVTALTAPPSPSGSPAVPAFSKKAHALLNTPARKNDAR